MKLLAQTEKSTAFKYCIKHKDKNFILTLSHLWFQSVTI